MSFQSNRYREILPLTVEIAISSTQVAQHTQGAKMIDEKRVYEWFAEKCEKNVQGEELSSHLFKSWNEWSLPLTKTGTNKRFSDVLCAKGFTKYRNRRGVCFMGISLKK